MSIIVYSHITLMKFLLHTDDGGALSVTSIKIRYTGTCALLFSKAHMQPAPTGRLFFSFSCKHLNGSRNWKWMNFADCVVDWGLDQPKTFAGNVCKTFTLALTRMNRPGVHIRNLHIWSARSISSIASIHI